MKSIQSFSSILAVIEARAQEIPEKEVLVFRAPEDTQVYQYAQFFRDVQQQATRFDQAGMKTDGLVLLSMSHSYELVCAFFACLYLGAIPAIYPEHTVFSASENYASKIQKLVDFHGFEYILTDAQIGKFESATLLNVHPADQQDFQPVPVALRQKNDVAYIQFSSGSTGDAKAILLSQLAILDQIVAMEATFPCSQADVFVGWAPFFHDMGLIVQLFSMALLGAKSIIIPPADWVRRPKLLFSAISEYQGTISAMPNFAFFHSVKGVREKDLVDLDLQSWRLLINGSEPVDSLGLEKFYKHFAPYGFQKEALAVGYGLAEAVVGLTLTLPDTYPKIEWVSGEALQRAGLAKVVPFGEPDSLQMVSCGLPSRGPKNEVAIRNERGEVLPERNVGEVIIKNSRLFLGYHNQPELTQKALQDGWLLTGDLGYIADGELFICGRMKDLIISAGKNIYPDAIERKVTRWMGKPAGRAVLLGIAHPELGTELPVLIVEYRAQQSSETTAILRKDIQALVQTEFNITLNEVHFVRRGWVEITTSGKLARNACRQKYFSDLEKTIVPESSLANDQLVRVIFKKHLSISEVEDDADFFEVGGSSIVFLKMIVELEDVLGVKLDYKNLMEVATIENILASLDSERAAAQGDLATTPIRNHSILRVIWQTPALSIFEKLGESMRVLQQYFWNRGPLIFGFNLSYRTGAKMIAGLTRNPIVLNGLLRRVKNNYAAFLEQLGIKEQQDQSRQSYLMLNIWRFWRVAQMVQTPDQYVSIQGAAKLLDLLKKRQPVIVILHHSPLQELVKVAVGRLIHEHVEEQVEVFLVMNPGEPLEQDETVLKKQMAQQVLAAHSTLKNKGLVAIAGDGQFGNLGVALPFFGKRRMFGVGFAELAILTKAEVIPSFVSYQNGLVQIEFSDPIQSDQNLSPVAQTLQMLNEYVSLLADHWRKHPDSQIWKRVEEFLNLPDAPEES